MRGNVIDEYASKLRGSGSSHSKRASADDVDLIAGMRASVVDEYKSKMRADLAKRGVDAETAALIADIRGNVVDEYATKLRGASSLSKRDSSSSTIDDLSAYVSDMRGNVVDEYKAKLRGSTLSKRAIDSELADLVADMRGNVVDEMLQTIRAGGADSSDVAKRAERSEVAGARGAFVESMRKLVRGGGGGDKVKRDSVGAIQPTQLIDYWPMITSPSGGETFVAGQNASASWNQTLPSGIDREDVGDTANLVLGFKEEGSSSLNLCECTSSLRSRSAQDAHPHHADWTLAEDVPLWAPNDNEVTFTFPASLKARDTYIMVLVGSTSHTSAEFSILPAF